MNIIPMQYEGQRIETLVIEGKPFWVAKDIASFLGYKDTTNAIKQHCKGVAKHHPLQTAGGKQNVRIISEPDLYRLIANSKLPSAAQFEAWIFEEVLPTIRKTGSYTTPQHAPVKDAHGLLEVDKAFRAALRMAKAIGLDTNAAIISANQLARKVTGSDALEMLEVRFLERPLEDLPLTPTAIGQFIGGISGQAVNKVLCASRYQEKVGDVYVATTKGAQYAVLVDTGKRHTDGAPVHQLKWKKTIVDQLKTEILNQVEPETVTAN
jgi:prophage antirepressor-like protein